MAEFDAGNNNVQGGERLFPLQPAHAPFSRRILRVRGFQHQPFVPPLFGLGEERLERDSLAEKVKRRELQPSGPGKALENLFALREIGIDQRSAVRVKNVEDHEDNWNLLDQRRRRSLTAQPLLQ